MIFLSLSLSHGFPLRGDPRPEWVWVMVFLWEVIWDLSLSLSDGLPLRWSQTWIWVWVMVFLWEVIWDLSLSLNHDFPEFEFKSWFSSEVIPDLSLSLSHGRPLQALCQGEGHSVITSSVVDPGFSRGECQLLRCAWKAIVWPFSLKTAWK